jgi:divalent metal cation (Fe/Co/Zn/Cd) transporter
MTVEQAHDVMEEIEAQLAAEFPGVEVLIHVDPRDKWTRRAIAWWKRWRRR